MSEGPLRIELDRLRCDGHGVCEEIAPQVYRLDDEGELEILFDPVPEELAAKAESGARLCPVAALRTYRQPGPVE
jgi:ferredoxin